MEAKFCKRVPVVEAELVGAKIEVGQFSVGVSGAEAVAVGPSIEGVDVIAKV